MERVWDTSPQLYHCTCCCRVHGKALRSGGYEVLAAFGALTAAECVVIGGDAGEVACGSSTELLVQPHDAELSGRAIPHQKALAVTVTGELDWQTRIACCSAETCVPVRHCTWHFEHAW